MTKKRVLIVGGGLAGLSAAESLLQTRAAREGNLLIELVESRSSTGGRAGSFWDAATGRSIDYCQHVTMGCCTHLLAMLERLELISHWRRYSELTFYHPDCGTMRFRPAAWLPAPLHLDSALRGLRYLSLKQKWRIRYALWRLMRTPTSSLGEVTAAEWLQFQGQGDVEQRLFWDVILVSALGDVTERVSMAAARKVMIDGFAGARGASDVWVPRRPLAELFGQMTSERLVADGLRLRCNWPIRSLVREKSAGTMVAQAGQDQPALSADHLILATAWTTSARLLKTLVEAPEIDHELAGRLGACRDAIASLRGSPITGVHLWLDRPLTTLPHVVMVGTLSQWLFCQPLDESTPATVSRQHYHQVVISGEHRLSGRPKESIVAAVMDELGAAFPTAGPVRLIRSRVVTDPQSVFSVSPSSQRDRPPTSIGLAGLSLAGDWVRTGWPATMEGAVISGRLAAIAACDALGLPPPPPPEPPLGRDVLPRWLIAKAAC